MNLRQIIHSLKGLKSGQRRRCLIEWDVDPALWPAIQACFDQEGNEAVETVRIKLLWELSPNDPCNQTFPKGTIVDAIPVEHNYMKFRGVAYWHFTDEYEIIPTEDITEDIAKDLPDLPDSIKAQFTPFETIDPADQRYMAHPRFTPYPDNHLKDWQWVVELTAEDGTHWFTRKYSPCRRHNGDFYDVLYCRVV